MTARRAGAAAGTAVTALAASRVLTDTWVLTGGGEEGGRTGWDPQREHRKHPCPGSVATRHRTPPQIIQHLTGNMHPKGLGCETAGGCLCHVRRRSRSNDDPDVNATGTTR